MAGRRGVRLVGARGTCVVSGTDLALELFGISQPVAQVSLNTTLSTCESAQLASISFVMRVVLMLLMLLVAVAALLVMCCCRFGAM